MRLRRRARATVGAVATAAAVAALLQGTPAWAGPGAEHGSGSATTAPEPPAAKATATPGPNTVAPADRGAKLGKDWQSSGDRAWSTSGDSTGFHLLVADAKAGYTWRTAATLSEPGVETDQWIGNACVTGSGKRAVVVYAPRAFTNQADTFDRGAFSAVVDLDTGKVTKLAVNASLAYFDPGCGTGETAVITQADDTGTSAQTRLQTVDAATGKVVDTSTVDGQATSAVPVGDKVVAASGTRLINVDRAGRASLLATTHGTALRLHPDTAGGVSFLDPSSNTEVDVKRLTGTKVSTFAHGKLGAVGLQQGGHGKVFLTGTATTSGALPATVTRSSAPAASDLSTDGELAISQATPRHLAAKVASPLQPAASDGADPVDITGTATATRKQLSFTVQTTLPASSATADSGAKPSPLLPFVIGGAASVQKAQTQAKSATSQAKSQLKAGAGAMSAQAAAASSDPVDQERYCSVPRNDPRSQVYQPTPNQVEWAADMAIRGLLTSGNISRPANWRQSGLPAWTPQGMFPNITLTTGGRIPAQVMLGVLAQESNLWQASSHAEPGEYGNPLVGNFYGNNIYPGTTGYDPDKIWKIDWTAADCGYGIGQATDGMRIAGHPKPNEVLLPPDQQRAVALDYATGISYSVRILEQKWNELHAAGSTIKLNDDDPARPENWFAATWDYNAGFNPPGSDTNWGLGWGNNPANPKYPSDRGAFLDFNHYADAATPQKWPYEEKVIGWGAYPIDTTRSYDDNGVQNSGNTHGYSADWWTSLDDRTQAIKPPLSVFCDSSNACDPSSPPVCHDVPCYTPHWYNKSVKWKNCSATPDANSKANQCGNEYLTYKTVRSEPGSANPHPGPCDASGLPTGSVVVDELPDSVPPVRCAVRGWSSGGTFSWNFAPDEMGRYEAREDLHQIGGGFGSHYYFSHGRQPNNWDNLLTTTGTWTSSLPHHAYKIQAFIPYLGKTTKSAHYEITTSTGRRYERVVDQSKASNGWVTVGYFDLSSNAKVSLSNVTDDSTSGDSTVAYDALAFTPISGYEHHTFDSVAIFDENQDIGTDTPWFFKTPMRTMTTLKNWAVERSHGGPDWAGDGTQTGITEVGECPTGPPSGGCVGRATYTAASNWYNDVIAAGDSPTNHPAGMSEATWMGYAVPRPGSTIDPDNSFTDDLSYKIKTHIDAAYVMGPDGKVVPGSESIEVQTRTGDTHFAPFMINFMKALQSDYGIAPPDLTYNEMDANDYTGTRTPQGGVDAGHTAGQAYIPHVRGAEITYEGDCVETRVVSGGTIGYRPLVAQDSVQNSAAAWSNAVKAAADAGRLPQQIATTAGDIKNMFFNGASSAGVDGSLFNAAPPIWQDASLAFCAGGKLKSTQAMPNVDSTPQLGLVYQSYMPDLYLYEDGHAIDNAGNPATGPVRTGDFRKFSALPGGSANAYDYCDSEVRGSGGNPWNITAIPGLADPAERPKFGQYCDNKDWFDTTYTP